MDMFSEPEFFVPLIVNLALGFVVALCSRKIVWSLVSCSVIPFVVVVVRYANIFDDLGSSSREGVGFGLAQAVLYVLIPGLVACWFGSFLGILARRFRTTHDDA